MLKEFIMMCMVKITNYVEKVNILVDIEFYGEKIEGGKEREK
jgi:hypothetical protein